MGARVQYCICHVKKCSHTSQIAGQLTVLQKKTAAGDAWEIWKQKRNVRIWSEFLSIDVIYECIINNNSEEKISRKTAEIDDLLLFARDTFQK